MNGPYPPNRGVGSAGQHRTGPHPIHPGTPPMGYPAGPMTPYPGPPVPRPPVAAPMPYPPPPARRRIGVVIVTAVVLVVLAAVTGYAIRGGTQKPAASDSIVTAASAKTAIQDYLDALSDRDIDAVARNTLCGIYDGVTDHRPDTAVARMNSDAFRKQFTQAEVVSVDKIVYLSHAQAQALFTMRVTRVSGSQRSDRTQGVAQLLAVDGEVLVCSYVLRSAGTL